MLAPGAGVDVSNLHALMDDQAIMHQATQDAADCCAHWYLANGGNDFARVDHIANSVLSEQQAISGRPQKPFSGIAANFARYPGVLFSAAVQINAPQIVPSIGFNYRVRVNARLEAWTQCQHELCIGQRHSSRVLGERSINQRGWLKRSQQRSLWVDENRYLSLRQYFSYLAQLLSTLANKPLDVDRATIDRFGKCHCPAQRQRLWQFACNHCKARPMQAMNGPAGKVASAFDAHQNMAKHGLSPTGKAHRLGDTLPGVAHGANELGLTRMTALAWAAHRHRRSN